MRPTSSLLPLFAACACATSTEATDPERAAWGIAAAIEAGDFSRARAKVTDLWRADELRGVRRALAAGDLRGAWGHARRARDLAPADPDARRTAGEVAALLLTDVMGEGRALLEAGDPHGAMAVLDEGLELNAEAGELRFLRGVSALRMGLAAGDPFFFADARTEFLAAAESGRVPAAWAGAGRAAYLAHFDGGDPALLEQALAYARRGQAEVSASGADAALLDPPPVRSWAEIVSFAYTSARQDGTDAARVAELFAWSIEALESLVGEVPEEPWAWNQLANLYSWESRDSKARECILRGLALCPESVALHEALVRTARSLGGSEAVSADYASMIERRPRLSLAHWYFGVERLEQALDALQADAAPAGGLFAEAEQAFQSCRGLNESYAEACLGREALCRSGLGWTRANADDLEGARDAFLSMEELFPGGLQWGYPGKLYDGIESLRRVATAYKRRAEDPEIGEDEAVLAASRAAEICRTLHELRPEDPDIANDTGFLNRDAGVALELRAEQLLARCTGLTAGPEPLDDTTRASLRAEAEAQLARAHEHMETSYRAYVSAARLAPEDARVINDTGLILAYYLQRDADRAREYFETAIAVGQARIASGVDEGRDLANLTEAIGDAHQNIGVLLLTLEGDAAGALEWFEKSLAIGPPSVTRPEVKRLYLPACRKVMAGDLSIDLIARASYWNDLEPERVLEKLTAELRLRDALR
ncbi:MAG: hypothetical protein CMJ84_00835 [Planctomycetes bacterium]|jgi:tetratricopeptide (TPR) repeat protein|nr:hypothetical protein [Planctomycetota bacterium]MDP6408579.1 hypothetical protein [Planctomycetota bacterium]